MPKKTTTKKPTKKLELAKELVRLGKTYAEALIEVCDEHSIPYHGAIEDTDAYPKLAREEQIEFAIGWFHGAGDALGIDPIAMWDAIHAELGAKAKRAA